MEDLPIDLSALVPEELKLERPVVLPDRDGYSALKALVAKMDALPARELAQLTEPDRVLPPAGSSDAAHLLLSSRDLDADFRHAVGLPFVFPQTPLSYWAAENQTAGPNDLAFAGKRLVRLMLRRASLLVGEGRHEEGASLAVDGLHLSHGFKAGHALMIQYMIGAAYEAMTTTWLHAYAANPTASADVLRSVLEQLPLYNPVDKALVRTYLTEFNDFLLPSLETQNIDELAEAAERNMFLEPVTVWPRKGGQLLDRRATLEGAIHIYLEGIASLRRPFANSLYDQQFTRLWEDLPELPEYEDRPSEDDVRSFQEEVAQVENALGKQIMSQISFHELGRLSAKLRADIEGLKARIGIRLHEVNTGTLPESLEVLRESGVLQTIPMDPTTGEPLRYDFERRLVWSAGPNARYDGGNDAGHPAWPMQPDWLYRL